MSLDEPPRPSPDALLKAARRAERGRLKVFLGASPGVGKTYEMLSDAAVLRRAGVDVVIGVIETHGRAETQAMTDGFEVIPRRPIPYRNQTLTEMDLDALLERKPRLALVDELAHTNAPGSRHPKRWHDVEELLAKGIDVYTTVNIQHLESLNDVVAGFTRVRVRETVPDHVLDGAELEVVDIPPDELIERLKAGKVYVPEEASRALGHFFSRSNLSALRELALRRAAQAVDAQMLDDLRAQGATGVWGASERVLVAVSELPGADNLVRAAKRLADSQRAPWTALYLESPRSAGFGPEEQQRVADTLRLASELGGQIVTIPAANVLDGIKAFAAESRITQIVVGKSQRSRWFELRHGSVVDRLVRETPGVAVHVMPMDDASTPRASVTRPPRPGQFGQGRHYFLTLALIAGVTGAARWLGTHLGIAVVALLYLLPVMFAAMRFGRWPGLFAGLASALAYNFFFLPPLHTFTIADPANVVTVLVLLGVAFVTSQLAARIGAEAQVAQRSARISRTLAGFARTLSAQSGMRDHAATLASETARLFNARAVVLVRGADGFAVLAAEPPDERPGAMDLIAADWAATHGEVAGAGTRTLSSSDWMFTPLRVQDRTLAVLALASDTGRGLAADATPLLASLVDQAALAFERQRSDEEVQEITQLRERDRLRATLLSSVSHDIRTPLTALRSGIDTLKSGEQSVETVQLLDREAARLDRFIANLLDMSRIETGGVAVRAEPVDLTDAVASAAHDMRVELGGHRIALAVASDLPLVEVDPRLFHHLLINLLDNASKYGGEGGTIRVVAERRADGLDLMIDDEGPGIVPGEEARIFETFRRGEGSDRTGGSGLGLAIVRGFAEAMGLTVTARNRTDRTGASFTVAIPEARLIRLGEATA